MPNVFQRHPVVIALSALAVILALVIAAEMGLASSLRAQVTDVPAKRAAPFEAKLLPPQQVVQAETLYPEIAARPLFTPTRRPAPAAAPPSTYTPGQFVLQGVIVAGGARTAMLREKSTGKMHRVEAGRDVNGIRVAKIEAEAVTLTQGADQEVLQLQVQRPGATPGAAPPGTGAGPFGPVTPAPPAPPIPGAVQPGAAPVPQPVPGVPTPAPQGAVNPLAAPPPGTNPNPATATTTPMSPEELLARRRARRGQQTQ
jgi:hypothetical protein